MLKKNRENSKFKDSFSLKPITRRKKTGVIYNIRNYNDEHNIKKLHAVITRHYFVFV